MYFFLGFICLFLNEKIDISSCNVHHVIRTTLEMELFTDSRAAQVWPALFQSFTCAFSLLLPSSSSAVLFEPLIQQRRQRQLTTTASFNCRLQLAKELIEDTILSMFAFLFAASFYELLRFSSFRFVFFSGPGFRKSSQQTRSQQPVGGETAGAEAFCIIPL